MAFTDQQKADIRFFLGYPAIYLYRNPRLENALQLIGDDAAAKARTEILLEKLSKIFGAFTGDPNAQLDKALQTAGISEVESADDRVLYGDSSKGGSQTFSSSSLNTMADYGTMLVGALSAWFGVDIGARVFGKGGYPGDAWARRGNQTGSVRNFLMGE